MKVFFENLIGNYLKLFIAAKDSDVKIVDRETFAITIKPLF